MKVYQLFGLVDTPCKYIFPPHVDYEYEAINKFITDTASVYKGSTLRDVRLLSASPKKAELAITEHESNKDIECRITVSPIFFGNFNIKIKCSSFYLKERLYDYFYDYLKRQINSFPDYSNKYYHQGTHIWIDDSTNLLQSEEVIKGENCPYCLMCGNILFMEHGYSNYGCRNDGAALDNFNRYIEHGCKECGFPEYIYYEYRRERRICSNPYCSSHSIKIDVNSGYYSILNDGKVMFQYDIETPDIIFFSNPRENLRISIRTQYFLETLIIYQKLKYLNSLK